MKNFKQFVKEEFDIRRSKGVPADFMRKAEEEARRNLRVTLDDERQMAMIGPELGRAIGESHQILMTGPDGRRLTERQLEDRYRALEELAETVVMSEFGEILELSVKPVELNIKLVRMGQVPSEIEDITEVPQYAKPPTEREQDQQKEREEQQQKEREKQEEKETDTEKPKEEEESKEKPKEEKPKEEKTEKIPGTDLVSASDKKKILNMITQAAGKSTKDIIKASDIIDQGLEDIFGNSWRRILELWSKISDLADKMDWVIPVESKAHMMSNMPGGMAGAVDVKWESITGNFYDLKFLLEKEVTKIVINAVGVDFPMLLHEAIKGIYLFLQSGAIKKDKKSAEIIKRATSSFTDEAQDFRYGPPALQMLLNFVNKFPESSRYKRLEARVFTMLAVDKGRAMEEAENSKEYKEYLKKKAQMAYTDEEFLEIMKSLFSVFDLQERAGKAEYVINEDRFNDSKAKTEIKKLIDYIVSDIEDYKRDLSEWEMEKKQREEREFYRREAEKEIDLGAGMIAKSPGGFADLGKGVYGVLPEEDEKEKEVDYSKLSQRQLAELSDDALDRGDYEEVKKIAKYMKEGKEIYLRELERINESYKYHTRRND